MLGRATNPLRWDGTTTMGPYLGTGLALSALKLLIDVTVTDRVFHREWTHWRYVFPGELLDLTRLSPGDRRYFLTMAALALPFVAVGVSLTIRRLRDAGAPVWLVALFFLPFPVNVFCLLTFAALPSRPDAVKAKGEPALAELPGDFGAVGVKQPLRSPLGAWLPEGDFACGLTAIVVSMPVALALGALSVVGLGSYGWGLFVGLPFVSPMVAVWVYGQREPRSAGECLTLGLAWFAAVAVCVVGFAWEGLICVIMLVPLALPLVLLGSLAGYYLQRPSRAVRGTWLSLLLLAGLPTLIGAEGLAPRTPPIFPVSTAVVVDAPPERVWAHVVTFSELPEPDDWVFRTGVAYPVRATIEGSGPGAVRRCEFSTGPFVEPIEVWDEPRLLQFSVTDNPPPMREWNPFAETHPPHLDGYLVSRRGEFRLDPLPGGRTRLEGTTWYRHSLWPAAYWKLWSDAIIHRIHLQVLRHVKRLAESDAPPPTGDGGAG